MASSNNPPTLLSEDEGFKPRPQRSSSDTFTARPMSPRDIRSVDEPEPEGAVTSRHFVPEKGENNAAMETRLSVDRKKITYILQTSDAHHQKLETSGKADKNLAISFSGEEDDSHCHSNKIRHSLDKKARTRLVAASTLCLMFMIGEMVGGLIAGSLAIISDAAHLLTDFASFMISLIALYLANKPATKKLSFGWYRAEILGAFTSILMLWVLTGILVYSAALRIQTDDYEIDAMVMLITAASGVAFNVVLGLTLHQHTHSHGGPHGHSHTPPPRKPKQKRASLAASHPKVSYGSLSDVEQGELTQDTQEHGHSHESNINVKAAFVHVLGDLFQSIGVLVAAFIIYFKPEWKIADPICTFMFSVFVLITTFTIMRDIIVVLMEGAPRGINFADVQKCFLEVSGVLDIHNLRVWSLTMDKVALSVHLAVDKGADPHRVVKEASRLIQERFGIAETTMQIEVYVEEMEDCNDCQPPQ